MSTSYKHAASVTGQVFFCAAPIRLDAYDGCQFGCIYCFSRKRARKWSQGGLHAANPIAFAERIRRVKGGLYASALDEFLAARVPIQLGGLQDPFTPRERERGITLALLRVLRDHDYPTLISTKGELLLENPYIAILKEMNVVVRFSAAGLKEKFRASVERRCASFHHTLNKIERLADAGIATGLRIQPVIPGFEREALSMTAKAASAGVRQVSFEYLKLAKESLHTDVRALEDATGVNVFQYMKSLGLTILGWDYVLRPDAKRAFVIEARNTCRKAGMRFGAGDTEFIPWSDGDGCCGSSSQFLKGSRQFQANFVGAIKNALSKGDYQVKFRQIERAWSPTLPVSTYLNWRSRIMKNDGTQSDWVSLMASRWNGESGPYSPAYFDGVVWTGKLDLHGMRVYDVTRLANALNERPS